MRLIFRHVRHKLFKVQYCKKHRHILTYIHAVIENEI